MMLAVLKQLESGEVLDYYILDPKSRTQWESALARDYLFDFIDDMYDDDFEFVNKSPHTSLIDCVIEEWEDSDGYAIIALLPLEYIR